MKLWEKKTPMLHSLSFKYLKNEWMNDEPISSKSNAYYHSLMSFKTLIFYVDEYQYYPNFLMELW